MNPRRVQIAQRFHGPPTTGNGGYVAGLLARELGGGSCTVTLHRPPPLDQPLEVRPAGEGIGLYHGEDCVASAIAGDLDLDVPAPPGLEQAQMAEADFVGHRRHRFPGCFVCGPERAVDDGLRIFAGTIGQGQVAASWTPGRELGEADGGVRSEFLWAALDCPGYFAVEEEAGLALLGRMTAKVHARPVVGEPLVVTGWSIASEGRKHRVGTALHTDKGELVAAAHSVWVTLAA